jgi:dipeptidase
VFRRDCGRAERGEPGDRRPVLLRERGINEKNLAVSATNSLTINPNAAKADPLLASGGIAECVIPTLILPQAETAVEAVRLLGSYVEQYGASEVNGVLFGDPDAVWYFENGSAHHWIAVKVPDDNYLVVANGMRVHGIDLESSDVLCSDGLYEFVVENGLLEHPDRQDFDFAQAFGILGVPTNEDRIWLAQSILSICPRSWRAGMPTRSRA